MRSVAHVWCSARRTIPATCTCLVRPQRAPHCIINWIDADRDLAEIMAAAGVIFAKGDTIAQAFPGLMPESRVRRAEAASHTWQRGGQTHENVSLVPYKYSLPSASPPSACLPAWRVPPCDRRTSLRDTATRNDRHSSPQRPHRGDRCPVARGPRARPVARLERETQRRPFLRRRVARAVIYPQCSSAQETRTAGEGPQRKASPYNLAKGDHACLTTSSRSHLSRLTRR
jgi:hypothetical protein